MIDKITPRPGDFVQKELQAEGVEGMEIVVTDRRTYIAPFVNAEGASVSGDRGSVPQWPSGAGEGWCLYDRQRDREQGGENEGDSVPKSDPHGAGSLRKAAEV